MPRLYNPYTINTPASGDAFVGREAQVEQIVSGRNSVVIGYSRFGKTSLLNRVAKEAEKEGSPAIYIGDCGSSQDDVQRAIRIRVRKDEALRSAVKSGSTLEETLLDLQDILDTKEQRLHILLDETDRLFAERDTVMAFRSYNESLNLPNIKLTYAIFPHVFAQTQYKVSRFQDTATLVPLIPHSLEETRQLVSLCTDEEKLVRAAIANSSTLQVQPYRLEEDFSGAIHAFTGGIPYFTQRFMQEVLELASQSQDPKLLRRDQVSEAMERMPRSIEEQTAHFWNSLTDLQKSLLTYIGDERRTTTELLRHAEADNPSVFLGALNPLSNQGVGILDEQHGEYLIPSVLMQSIIRRFSEFR